MIIRDGAASRCALLLVVVCAFLTLVVHARPARSQIYCGWVLAEHVQQDPGSSWCAFACMEYLTAELGNYIYQCNFANAFCEKVSKPALMDPFDCGSCCSLGDCTGYYPTVGEVEWIMNDLGFGRFAGGAVYWTSAISQGALYSELCNGNFLLLAYVKTGAFSIGHGAVAVKVNAEQDKYMVMDPGTTAFEENVSISKIINGGYGSIGSYALEGYMGVGTWDAGYVGVGDIRGFSHAGNSGTDVELEVTLGPSSDPAQWACLFVTDNPYGPVNLVDYWHPLTEWPSQDTTVSYWDTARLPQTCDYYYYLNYDNSCGLGPYPGAYFANSENTIRVDAGTPRDILGPPGSPTVTDVPFDRGAALKVEWALSPGDTDIDRYNIYRWSTPPFEPTKYLASVPRGTSMYIDSDGVLETKTYGYYVSAAHHGLTGTTTGGNLGIWNDFSSDDGEAIPVDQFDVVQASLLSPDSLAGAPNGSEGNIVVEVLITDSSGAPSARVPESLLCLIVESDSAYVCVVDSVPPDSATGLNGRTTFTIANFGGHDDMRLTVGMTVDWWLFDTVTVHVRSPDGNYDGTVDLIDFAMFGPAYPSYSCQDANYDRKWDLNFDCAIDIIDFSVIGNNFQTWCPE